MIKCTLRHALEAVGAINSLAVDRIPAKVKYNLGKLADAIQKEAKRFQKEREAIFVDAGCTLRKTGKKDPSGTEIEEYVHAEGDGAVKTCQEKVEELLDVEVELHALQVDMDQFKDKDGKEIDLTGHFAGLTWAVKESPAEEAKK